MSSGIFIDAENFGVSSYIGERETGYWGIGSSG
jgi:hypothetical protein